jgi:tripartite-type tricarboxylate transporter receptor subunit TctC
MNPKHWSFCAAAGMAAVICGAAHAQSPAQSYPNKFVKFVVTYPPGGSSDVMSRIVGHKLTDYWGQQVIVETKPGADGAIGMEYAAKQPADGYTFVLGNFGPVVAKPLLSTVSYDWKKDFTPVSQITQAANILVVPVNSPFKSIKDIVAAAKAKPGTLTYGTSGPGSMSHFTGEMFKRLAGVDFITVNYKGNVQAVTELIGGQITIMFSDALPAMQNMKSGKLKALAVTSEKRWPFTPELPTLAEEGVKGFAAVNWWGILFPAGVPKPIIDKVAVDIARAVSDKDTKAKLGELGVETVSSAPEEFGAFMSRETERWGKLIREANLKLDPAK